MPIDAEKLQTALDLIYLCCCALRGEQPHADRLAGLDFRALYALSRSQMLTALVCEGLELAGDRLPDDAGEAMAAFREAKARAVRKNLMFDLERTKLTAFLEQSGIWHMPLKGAILKDMYPKLGLRQMSDNDILFDPDFRETVRDWFVGQGYTVKVYDRGPHDVYQKEPFYNFEMHVELFSDEKHTALHDWHHNIRRRLLPDAGKTYACHFTDEDFYCYFLAHAYKHDDNAGIGLRYLFDNYVYLQHKRETMDRTALDAALTQMGIADFAQTITELTDAIFADIHAFSLERLTESRQQTLLTSVFNGVYGTMEQRTAKDLARYGSKGRYLLWRFFPGTRILQAYHPIFRHKWLMPIGWVWRAVVILKNRAGVARRELGFVFRRKKD